MTPNPTQLMGTTRAVLRQTERALTQARRRAQKLPALTFRCRAKATREKEARCWRKDFQEEAAVES
jgi:hypothetical protein